MLKYFLLLPLIFSGQCFGAEKVLLATYYPEGPWYYTGDRSKGVNAALANKLSDMSRGRYQFESVLIPRKRLEVFLETSDLLIAVPWVHPRFFNDINRTRHLWTGALMEDTSFIVSPNTAPLEYNGPESLRGKRFAAPAGHQFPDLQGLIATKEIVRVEVPHVGNALRMMLVERQLDFAVVDKSTLVALKSDPLIDQTKLHIAKRPRTATYERSVLVPARLPALHAFLKQAVAELSLDEGWIELAMHSSTIKMCYSPESVPGSTGQSNANRWARLLDTMGRQTGAKFEARALPWPSCLAALQSGKMDGAVGVGYTKELAQHLAYPEADGAVDLALRLGMGGDPPDRRQDGKAQLNAIQLTAGTSPKVEAVHAVSGNPLFLVFGKKFYAQNTKEVRAIWNALPRVKRARLR